MPRSRRLTTLLCTGVAFSVLAACNEADNPMAPPRRNDQLSLDGLNDYGVTQQAGKLGLSGKLTVEGWVKLSRNVVGEQGRIIDRQSAFGQTESWGVEVFGNGYGGSTGNELVFHANDCSAQRNLRSGANLTPGIWYHVAAVSDGVTLRLYVDGRLTAELAALGAPCDPADVPLVVGRTLSVGPSFQFPGEIDELRVWSTARTVTEIEQGAEGVDPKSPGLIAYWTFDDPLAAVQPDRTGHGYDLHVSR